MVDVKDGSFPRLVIVVVRKALVALGDEAIGAHLREGWRRNEARGHSLLGLCSRATCYWGAGRPFDLGGRAQAPWCTLAHVCACTLTPLPRPSRGPPERPVQTPPAASPTAPAVESHLVTELKGREQQEGSRGGTVDSPVFSVQGLRSQKPGK